MKIKITFLLVLFCLAIMPFSFGTVPNPGHLCSELDTSNCAQSISSTMDSGNAIILGINTNPNPSPGGYGIWGNSYRNVGVKGTGVTAGVYGEATDKGIYGLCNTNNCKSIYGTCSGAGCYGIYTPNNAYVGGSVGIGTTAPSSKLEVNGDIEISNLNTCTGTNQKIISDSNGKLICGTDLSGGTSYWQTGTGGIYYNGNVGIGTTTPNEKLEVASTTARAIISDGAGINRRGLLLVGPTANDDYGRIEAYNYAGIGIGKNLVFNNLGGGNVGIGTGTTAPTSKLEVNGNIEANKIGRSGIAGFSNPSIEFVSDGNLIITLG